MIDSKDEMPDTEHPVTHVGDIMLRHVKLSEWHSKDEVLDAEHPVTRVGDMVKHVNWKGGFFHTHCSKAEYTQGIWMEH